tara:strand:+ start:100 stop:996 length:897 start_codon:yes stop_codon:yes gene_type:complete
MSVNWTELLTVDCSMFSGQFNKQADQKTGKINIRGFTIPFVGNQQKFNRLMNYLDKQLRAYVFPESEINEQTWRKARDKFGNNNPEYDGKLGEMLLYIFVEAILGTPLMAYKLKDLGNPNDQVKGADGIFVGTYEGKRALLIGESKIHCDFKGAIKSAIESIQRFHDGYGPYSNELSIAKKFPRERELNQELLEETMRLLNEDYEILVHPVFISYSLDAISNISQKSSDKHEAENALRAHFETEINSLNQKILSHKNTYPKPYEVCLDFFFLPVEDCLKLRSNFYELLHGCPYEVPKK